jgi:prepilin-type N-terminal cleavage/methylation domain-containing protein/prepilin-type processing-associated H-X9-DG protein
MDVEAVERRWRYRAGRRWTRAGSSVGFTLIELLVVVAIIALLISILLPSLAQARAQGKAVACGSNLRQMGIALQSYLQENEDFYPGEHSWKNNVAVNVWAPRLRLYAAMQEKLFWCPAADPKTYWEVRLNWPFVPAWMQGYGYQVSERPVFSGEHGDLFPYGYNSWGVGETFDPALKIILGLGANVDDDSCPWVWSVRAADVKRPADMIAIADSKADGVWDSAIDPETWQDHEWPSARHYGGAQVLHCDGHVAYGKQKQLVEPTQLTRRRWNNDFLPHEEYWQDWNPPGSE